MKHFLFILVVLYSAICVQAQDDSDDNYSAPEAKKAYSPTIGFGLGTVAIYGDLNDRDYGSPFGSNPGFNVFIVQPVNDYLKIKFNYFSAKVREEERSLQRNVNFESDFNSGSVLVEYNFNHFLPENRKVTPFITAGIEVVEFNPKSDLEAFGGEPYNYWTDGTIRNISESAANANQAVIIQRDYNYETDIREAGYNNSTTYDERAIAVPLGLGVDMHLTDQINFRFESVVHLTFSDYLDGLTRNTKEEFIGGKRANGRNDHFLYNGASISYNFQKITPADDVDGNSDEPFDYLASGNTEDYDNDGVIDLIDLCGNTPPNVEVDTNGCPIDTDKDGIADYLDKEPNSEFPEFANDEGVEMTDEMIYQSYMRFQDSTLEFAEVIQRNFSGNQSNYKKYRVKIGEYNKGETPPNMEELLSYPDLKKVDQGDKSIYTVGSYKTLKDANERIQSLKASGVNAEVLKKNAGGNLTSLNQAESEILESTTAEVTRNNEALANETGVAFRVQLGAFRKQPTVQKYKDIPGLFVIETDGIYKYLSGSFDNFAEAAKHKVKMVVAGYEGAFVVAYKDGKRVKLRTVGVKPITSNPLIGE